MILILVVKFLWTVQVNVKKKEGFVSTYLCCWVEGGEFVRRRNRFSSSLTGIQFKSACVCVTISSSSVTVSLSVLTGCYSLLSLMEKSKTANVLLWYRANGRQQRTHTGTWTHANNWCKYTHRHPSHGLSLEINVGVIHSAGPDHIKMDGPPGAVCVCVCVCAHMHTGPHLSVFSPQLGPVT